MNKKRNRGPRATVQQLRAILKQARETYEKSDAYRALVVGIQECPENAGCYTTFKAVADAAKPGQTVTETELERIHAAAEQWDILKEYCPHCSEIVEQNRQTRAYQNYVSILKRVTQRLGIPKATVIGFELPDEKEGSFQ